MAHSDLKTGTFRFADYTQLVNWHINLKNKV